MREETQSIGQDILKELLASVLLEAKHSVARGSVHLGKNCSL
jgi:hypothetical protein